MEASGPPMQGPLLGEEGGNRSQRELRSKRGLLTQNPGDGLYPSADSTLFRANRAAAPWGAWSGQVTHCPHPAAPTTLLTEPEKPWVLVLAQTQPFSRSLGLNTTLSAQEGRS